MARICLSVGKNLHQARSIDTHERHAQTFASRSINKRATNLVEEQDPFPRLDTQPTPNIKASVNNASNHCSAHQHVKHVPNGAKLNDSGYARTTPLLVAALNVLPTTGPNIDAGATELLNSQISWMKPLGT